MLRFGKKFFGLLVIVLCLLFSGCVKNPSSESEVRDYEFTIQHDGLTRKYRAHVPPSYDNILPTPAVIYIHGGGGSAEASRKDGLYDESDEHGFILLTPDGTGPMKNILHAWNSGEYSTIKGETDFCCGYPIEKNIDDIGFISKMIEDAKQRFTIDENRIYSTGISNGGMMSYRLACELSDKIAAIAPVSSPATPINCKPTRAVPVIHIHGTADPCALYGGGLSPGCIGRERYMQSAKYQVSKWINLNRCSEETEIFFQKGDAECISYYKCKEGSDVVFCTIEGGGHTYPSGNQYLPKRRIGPVSYNISFDQIWEFFKEHPMK